MWYSMKENIDIMTEMYRREAEGYKAYYDGKSDSENPYQTIDEITDWDDGWIKGWKEDFHQKNVEKNKI